MDDKMVSDLSFFFKTLFPEKYGGIKNKAT